MEDQKSKTDNKIRPEVIVKPAKKEPAAPRKYIGPKPVSLISNLSCGCKIPADQLSRAEQDFVIETIPEASTWFEQTIE